MVDLVQAGLLLVFVGLGVMVVSFALQLRKGGAKVRGGGVILIGPIPIIFGSDARWASVAIVLALLLILLSLLVYGR
jgi:uncharacterized protein (TIGR00304 family)